MTWTVPVEISVAIPSLGAGASTSAALRVADEPTADAEAFRRKLDEDYTNREGFQVRFVPGFRTKFPRLSTKHRRRAAKNEEARDGDDPFLLPYEHFSVVVEGKRGLPLYTASNIDGKNLKKINRRTGRV